MISKNNIMVLLTFVVFMIILSTGQVQASSDDLQLTIGDVTTAGTTVTVPYCC